MKRIVIILAVILSFMQLSAQEQYQEFTQHTVKRGDTVNKISKKYGIKVQELLKINPDAKTGLKRGMVLFIPLETSTNKLPQFSDTAVAANNPDSVISTGPAPIPAASDSLICESACKVIARTSGNPLVDDTPLSIGLVLTLTSDRPADNDHIACLDFYSGFLLAIKHMQDKGLKNLTLNVYDTHKYSCGSGLAMPAGFEDNDIIIGPVRKREIESVLPTLAEKSIPLVSPFDPGVSALVPEYGNLVQAALSVSEQDSLAVELFCKSARASSVKPKILFEQDSGDKIYELTCSRLKEYGIEWQDFGYTILQGRNAEWKIASSLDTLEEHQVFIASNSEAFVNDAVRNLVIISEKRDIKLYGLPKWRYFETIDALSYHKLKLSMPLQYWTNYNSHNENLSKLLSEYRAMYGCEPNTYVLQGYDMAVYFIYYGKKYGPGFIFSKETFPEEDSSYKPETINARYRFERKNPNSGFKNNAVRVILYERDLTVRSQDEDLTSQYPYSTSQYQL